MRSARKGDVALVPHGHRRFAKAVHGDVAVIVDGGHAFVAAVVLGPAGHVFLAAVGESRGHDELLLGRRAQRCFLRETLQSWSRARRNPAGAGMPCAIQPEMT